MWHQALFQNMSIQLVPLSRLVPPSPAHNIRLFSSSQCLSRYTEYDGFTWTGFLIQEMEVPPAQGSRTTSQKFQHRNARKTKAPGVWATHKLIYLIVNIIVMLVPRSCQEYHRFGRKVEWDLLKGRRSCGAWWERRKCTMSWFWSNMA